MSILETNSTLIHIHHFYTYLLPNKDFLFLWTILPLFQATKSSSPSRTHPNVSCEGIESQQIPALTSGLPAPSDNKNLDR